MQNPVVFQTVGDKLVGVGRILSVIWTGATAAGDTVQLNGGDFWEGRTNLVQTYQGVVWAPYGMPVPGNALELTQISNGRVLIYLLEA